MLVATPHNQPPVFPLPKKLVWQP